MSVVKNHWQLCSVCILLILEMMVLKETTNQSFLIQVDPQPPPPVSPELVQLSTLMSTTSRHQLETVITPLMCSDECQQSDILGAAT